MTNEDELDIKEVPVGAYNFMDCWHTDDRGGHQRDRGVHRQFPGSSSITVPGTWGPPTAYPILVLYCYNLFMIVSSGDIRLN